MSYFIEIATSDYNTTKSALDGGADRIELCANLSEGGTTPSYATIKKCRSICNVQLFTIIRPRGGDFLYTPDEFEIMLQDIRLCKQLGCDGVVLGILHADGSIDYERTSKLVDVAYPMDVTFHRAFDRCTNPSEALEQIINTGCTRILTSGQREIAVDGIELIGALQKQADDRIIIMPGGGIRKDNIKHIATQTGCTEFHSSLRSQHKSPMQFLHPAFSSSKDSYFNNCINPNEVEELKQIVQS